ncbi:TetR/AcrR family transcriptional regulator [Streptomyces sp. B-S-A8]|uniref:TetR/AcrR family transcriptional regulator n=1 Tax=Streptomyces solicavernae TaxID=3043614 RepID=A0ABT6RT50_9ACTN|nr:TetR/AcrR family transcriptional regulator [Streptomyces sp. B-S-A8]MDI3387510.1 TetR/AcrR family transcriptional regulator [Streptomyces sp. B-S-A8]
MRKEPRQQRSRHMVERIVAAGQLVLSRDGYARFATTRVADEAAISPGSLYQYFRDKDELLTVLMERFWTETGDRVTASLADRFTDPPERLIPDAVEALLSAMEYDSQLLRVVVEEVPPRYSEAHLHALRRRIHDLGSAYLAGRAPGERSGATRSWVIVAAMEALSVRWVLERPPIPRELLIEELTALVTNYMNGTPTL